MNDSTILDITDTTVLCNGEHWVFAYGSLLWDPGFTWIDRKRARLWGYHRDFCLLSHRYRGTIDQPGLVLGLRPGGSCTGLVFRVSPTCWGAAQEYLWDREMRSNAYVPKTLPVAVSEGGRVEALAFVCSTCHQQFAAHLTVEEQAERIAAAVGERGANCDYLFNTVRHLRHLGFRDRRLETIAHRVHELRRASPPPP